MEDSPDGIDAYNGSDNNVCNIKLYKSNSCQDDELNDFDKRLKNNKADPFFNQGGDSSDEDDNGKPVPRRMLTEADVLKEKNRILMEKLFKSDKQVHEYKDLVETMSGKVASGGDIKEKKILELAKKNRALQLQCESLKTKAAKAAEFAIKIKKENDSIAESPVVPKRGFGGGAMETIKDGASTIGGGSTIDAEKRFKEQEKKTTKLRNENQQLKLDLDKAMKCLEKETGEVINLDELLKDDTQWKGRAQKIEVLKSQVKKLKQDLHSTHSGGFNDGLSVISETTGFGGQTQFGRITQAEKNLSKLENNRAKDLEKALKELEETREELGQLKTKYKAAVARRDTLEAQMKEFKSEISSKMKILIEKTENDDKLIQLLKSEIKRLEAQKGVKSSLQQAAAQMLPALPSDLSEVAKLKAENGRLKNQIKCLEIEVEQKEDKVKKLLTNCIGVPDENVEEKELRIAELEDRCEFLEAENFKIRQEMQSTKSKGFGKPQGETTSMPARTKDETDKIIADLSKQNATLRRKLDDAMEKLGKYETNKK